VPSLERRLRKKRAPEEDWNEYRGLTNEEIEVNTERPPIEGQPGENTGGLIEMDSIISQLLHNSSDFSEVLQIKIKEVLLNDTTVTALWSTMFKLVQRVRTLELTTPAPFATTTANYLNTDVTQNQKINDLLNKLLELQVKHGLKYRELLKSKKPLDSLVFSSNPEIDAQVKKVFQSLAFLSKVYNISFKDFYLKLE